MDCVNQPFFGPSVPDNQHQFERVRPLDLQFDPLGYIIHLVVALDKTNPQKTASGTQYLHYMMVFTRKMPVSLIDLITKRVALRSFLWCWDTTIYHYVDWAIWASSTTYFLWNGKEQQKYLIVHYQKNHSTQLKQAKRIRGLLSGY